MGLAFGPERRLKAQMRCYNMRAGEWAAEGSLSLLCLPRTSGFFRERNAPCRLSWWSLLLRLTGPGGAA